MLAQFTAVERPCHHRSAALRTTGGFRVIIRKGQRHVEAHRRLAGEEIDGLRPVGKKHIDARGIETVAGLMPQIGPRLVGALVMPQSRASEVPESRASRRSGR